MVMVVDECEYSIVRCSVVGRGYMLWNSVRLSVSLTFAIVAITTNTVLVPLGIIQ